MKRMFVFLLVLLLILSIFTSCILTKESNISEVNTSETVSINMEQKTLNFTEINMKNKIKIQGRYSYINQSLTFDMVCETLEFNSYCKNDVFINLTIQSLVQEYWNCYFTVFVDGVQQERAEVKSSSLNPEVKSMIIATGLPASSAA